MQLRMEICLSCVREQIIIRGRINCELYKESMKLLGVLTNGSHSLVSIPNADADADAVRVGWNVFVFTRESLIQMKWSHNEDDKGHMRGKIKCGKHEHLSNYFQENMISCYFSTH